MSIEWFICRKYLTSKKNDSLTQFINILAITGIAIGVMVLIIVISTINGFQRELQQKIMSIDPHILVVKNHSYYANIKDKNLNNLVNINGVTSVDITIQCGGLLRSPCGVSGVFIKGINFQDGNIPSCTIITKNKVSNIKELFGKKGPTPIILGTSLAKKLNVVYGEVIYLITSISDGNFPTFIPLKVVGLLTTGIQQYDSILAYVDIADISSCLNIKGLTNSIEIRIDDAYDSARVAQIIRDKIGPEFLVKDWTETNSNLFLLLKVQKYIVFIILSLVILVATISVSSTLIMMVLNKVRDVFILKSMGVSNFSIGKIFIFRGIFIGFMGIIYGTVLGFSTCYLLNKYELVNLPKNVYPLNKLPISINYQEIGIILSFTMIICLLSSIYPAYKAYSLSPSEIIHFD